MIWLEVWNEIIYRNNTIVIVPNNIININSWREI